MLSSVEKVECLIDRVVDGDAEAARILVEIHEPSIKDVARKGLTSARLRRVVDVGDISQAVFEQFFSYAKKNPIRVSSHDGLFAFLSTITRNLIIDEHRKYSSQKRGGQVLTVSACSSLQIRENGPSTTCEIKDLFELVRTYLSPSERDISDLRLQGCSWTEISQKTGKPQDQLRKKLHRAYARIRSQNVAEYYH